MNNHLQGAALSIGSLYWESEQNAIETDKGKLRGQWRTEELQMEASIVVKCPIRYGRKSA